jgi:hypothetical protein
MMLRDTKIHRSKKGLVIPSLSLLFGIFSHFLPFLSSLSLLEAVKAASKSAVRFFSSSIWYHGLEKIALLTAAGC